MADNGKPLVQLVNIIFTLEGDPLGDREEAAPWIGKQFKLSDRKMENIDSISKWASFFVQHYCRGSISIRIPRNSLCRRGNY